VNVAARIEKELAVLIGEPLSGCSRAAAMQTFGFGPTRAEFGWRGRPVVRSAYALHLQCPWRLTDADEHVVVASGDIIVPADGEYDDDFDWDSEQSWRDRVLDNLTTAWRSAAPTVTAIEADAGGGVAVSFDNGFRLEVFPNMSAPDAELWRFLRYGSDDPHFVWTADGPEEPRGG